jgi:hypothetical protein
MTKSALTAAALALCTFTGTASAHDTLTARAVNALSIAIAGQGDAALSQIRKELKQSAIEAFKPFLPKSEKVPAEQPAETPVARK